jgi:hypothetical protein
LLLLTELVDLVLDTLSESLILGIGSPLRGGKNSRRRRRIIRNGKIGRNRTMQPRTNSVLGTESRRKPIDWANQVIQSPIVKHLTPSGTLEAYEGRKKKKKL